MDAKEASVYFYLICAATLLGIIILYFIISLLNQQKKFRMLNAEKVNVELTTLEAERKRIASDLHDELGPVLSSAKNILESIEHLDAEDLALQQQAITYIDSSISRMRIIAKSLMPNSIVRKGLPFAINEFLEFTVTGGLRVQFNHNNLPELPEIVSIQLFRIVQEIVHNTIKHAKASQLVINLHPDGRSLLLQTADDGQGFDHELAKMKGGGLGLNILDSRVTLLKGDLHVRSVAQQGTSYVIRIPISHT